MGQSLFVVAPLFPSINPSRLDKAPMRHSLCPSRTRNSGGGRAGMPVRSRPTMRRVDRRRSSLRHPRRPKNARDNHRGGHQPFPSLPSPASLFAAKNDPVTKNLRSPFPVRCSELLLLDIPQFHKDQLLHLSSNVDHRIVVLVSPSRAMTRRSHLVSARRSVSVPKVLPLLPRALEAQPNRSSSSLPLSDLDPKTLPLDRRLGFPPSALPPSSVPRQASNRSPPPFKVFSRNSRSRVEPVKVLRGARTRVTFPSDSASLRWTRRSSPSRHPRRLRS